MITVTVKIPIEIKYSIEFSYYYLTDTMSLWSYYRKITEDHIISFSIIPGRRATLILSDRVVKGQL